MQGYDIQGNGLRVSQLRGGVGPFSRLQSAGAFGGLVVGMLVIALGNIVGWAILPWTLLPALVGGVAGTHVLGVSLVGHACHAVRYALAQFGWGHAGPRLVEPIITASTPIMGTLMDGEQLVWQVAMPVDAWERR